MKQSAKRILSALLLAVFLFSTGRVIVQWLDNAESDASYKGAEAIALSSTKPTQTEPTAPEETQPSPTEAPQPPEPVWVPAPVEEEDPNLTALEAIDLDALRQVNENVVGWIQIPGTLMNYPLLQGEDNSFYLEHTWEDVPNAYGSIFLEHRNSPDMTDFNTIIYGHNMSDGSMFAGLSYYAYDWFWTWNRYIYIVTDEGVFRYEVFSSYEAGVESSTYGLSFQQEQTRVDFIAMALENSQIHTGVTPATTDRIITLSTCTGMGYETRRVVHARLKMIQPEGAVKNTAE